MRLKVPAGHQGTYVSPDAQRYYSFGGKIRVITVAPQDVDWLMRCKGCTRVDDDNKSSCAGVV